MPRAEVNILDLNYKECLSQCIKAKIEKNQKTKEKDFNRSSSFRKESNEKGCCGKHKRNINF